MTRQKTTYLLTNKGFTIIILMIALLWSPPACQRQTHPIPLATTNHLTPNPARLGRIDLPQQDLEAGLTSTFQRLTEQIGALDYQPLVKNYAPLVRKSLYNNGFCGIRRLNLNGATIDLDIYFLIDKIPATLNIDVYIDGSTSPAFILTNKYLVSSQ
jgi:hypothetical protein